MDKSSNTIVFTVLLVSVASMSTAYEPINRYPDPGFTWQHHSSTVAEGFLRGTADVVRAVGEADVNHSIAATNYEEAYRRNLENKLKTAETYYARREVYHNHKESYRRRTTPEQAKRVASYGKPERLSDKQFNAATSKLFWPTVLKAKFLDDLRTEAEELMASRTPLNAGDGSANYKRIAEITEEMVDALGFLLRVKDVPMRQFVEAKKFLTSLEYEARFAPEIAGLVMTD